MCSIEFFELLQRMQLFLQLLQKCDFRDAAGGRVYSFDVLGIYEPEAVPIMWWLCGGAVSWWLWFNI